MMHPNNFGDPDFSSNAIIRSTFKFVQYFDFMTKCLQTNDIPISLSCALCFVLISKC